jgi:hypothetical protein
MNTTTNRKAFYLPSIDCFESDVRSVDFQARLADNDRTQLVCYSVLWFIATGREFSGLQRVCSHMRKGTVKALIARIERGMMARAKARGSEHLVTGDLDNSVLASALGFSDIAAASNACCEHPYGKAYTFGA